MRPSATRRLIALCLAFAFSVAVVGCGGGSDRERNAQTIAGQPCRTLGQTKTVSKVVNVCGRSGADLVWYAAVSRKPTGGKCTRPGGYRLANAKALVCAVIDKKRMWIEVAPLPFMPMTSSTVAGETTSPSNVGAQGSAGTTVPPATTAPSSAEGAAKTEAAAAFAELAPRSAVPRDDVPSKSGPADEVIAFAKANLPPVRLALTSKPATSRNGGNVSPAPTFQMVDEVGGARPAANIEVRVTSATVGAVVTGGIGVTDAKGAVSFPNLTIGGPAGRVDLAVLAEGYEGSAFTIDHSLGDAVGVVILESADSVRAGATWIRSPRIQLIDVNGFAVAKKGASFDLVATDEKGNAQELGTAVTDDQGIAEFGEARLTKVGKWKITIEPSSAAIEGASYDLEVFPADAYALSVLTRAPAQVINGVELASDIKVQLTDEFGNPVARAGVKVVADIRKQDRQPLVVTGASATTDAKGVATFDKLKVVGAAGMLIFGFSAPDNPSFESNSGIWTLLVAGAPAALTVGVEPWFARSGLVLLQVPQVYLVDQSGNKVALEGEEVEVVADRPVTITNGKAKFNSDGVAVFEGLSIAGTAGVLKLTFVYGALTRDFEIALISGPLAKLRIKEHPRSIVAGEVFGSVVELLDAQDNLMPYAGYTVVAKLDGASRLRAVTSGTTGLAVVDSMSIGASGRHIVSYEAINESGNQLIVATVDVTVAPSSPYSVEVVGSADVRVKNDEEFGAARAAITVQVRDVLGNAVLEGQQARAFVVKSPGDYKLTGDTATTDENGRATFSKLKIVGVAGPYEIGFQVPGYNSVVYGGKINVVPGLPVALRIKRSLAGLANRATASVQPILEAVDSAGNVSPAMNILVEAWIEVGGASPYLADEAASVSDGTVTFDSIEGRGEPGSAKVTYMTSMIKRGVLTTVSEEVQLAPGAPVSFRPLVLGRSIRSGTAVGWIAAFDADGYRTPIKARSIMLVLRGTLPTAAPVVWLNSAVPPSFSEGGFMDGTQVRLYGLKGANAILEVHFDGAKTLELPLTFTTDPAIGDPGPGLGVIAASLSSAVPPVSGITGGGRLIEIAPPDFQSGTPADFWGVGLVETVASRRAVTKDRTGIGTGPENTRLLNVSQTTRGSDGVARAVAAARINGLSDWFLGSISEYVDIELNLRSVGKPYAFSSRLPTASSSDFSDSETWMLDPATRSAVKVAWFARFVAVYPLRLIG